MRTLFTLAFQTAVGVALVAAPVPKEKEDKPGPITGEQLKQSSNNLKQILLAMHNYHDAMGAFPSNANPMGKKAVVSWRVAILPYLEEDKLYKEMVKDYNWDEAWDSEANKKFVEKMPKIYAPVRVKTKEAGATFYRGFTGAGTAFEGGKKITIPAFSDGTSNTIVVVEAGEPVAWTKPDDLPFDPKKDLPALGGLFDGDFHAAFADGMVRRVKAKADAATLKALITRSGGEVVTTDDIFVK